MIFPEGLKTVRWDREGKNITERHGELASFLATRKTVVLTSLVDIIDSSVIATMPDKLTPLCLEEWQEEHYNVMA